MADDGEALGSGSPRGAARPPARRRSRARTLPTAVVVGAVAIVLAGGRYAATAGEMPTTALRTATATVGAVEQTLTLTGTVSRVAQVTAAFPTSGRVTSVDVTVGQAVSAGQQLATMDREALQQGVLDAQVTLDQARANLANDTAALAASSSGSASTSAGSPSATSGSGTSGSATSGSGSGQSGAGSGSTGGAGGAGGSGSAAGPSAALAAVTAAAAAQRRADQACAPLLSPAPSSIAPTGAPAPTTTGGPTSTAGPTTTPGPTSTAGPTATPGPTSPAGPTSTAGPTATTGPTGTAGPTSTSAQLQACLDALRAATAVQATAGGELTKAASAIAASQAALAEQSQALSARLAAAAKAATPNGGTAGAGAVTDAKLIVDRAAVTQAEAALTKAQHFLDAATLTAPIGGVIGTVPFSVGDTATTATGFVIVGPGASKVTVQVPQANLSTISLGQVGHVTVSGSPVVDGVVTAIALLPTASASTSAAAGSSSPTYAVDLLVAGFPERVGSGGKATVALVTKRVDNALIVPASAVTMLSTGTGVAQRVRDAVVTTVTVQIGAVGGSTIEVVGGLSAGDIVVIGDPTQPLPTNGNIPGLGGGLGGIGGVGGGNARVPAGR